MDCVKRIWYLPPMRAAKVQASLRIRAVLACAFAQSRQNIRCSLIQAENQENFQTENQIPGPTEWLNMRSWNLSWRNARRHKFAWRGSYYHCSDFRIITQIFSIVRKFWIFTVITVLTY